MTVKIRNRNVLSRVAIVLGLTLVAAACGSESDIAEAGSEAADSVTDATRPQSGAADNDAGLDDGEQLLPDSPSGIAAGGADEAMAEDAAEGEIASLTPATTAPSSRTADQASDEGFFGSTTTVVDDAETENNTFRDYGVRPFVAADVDPLSTFALDVDTASYSVARQWLESGVMPPAESVRVEEYLNSFDYDYVVPNDGLNVQADGGPSPYDDSNVIVRVGVQAERVANADRPDASLTFVVDTSGSMDRADRLTLVKTSLRRLTQELESRDSV